MTSPPITPPGPKTCASCGSPVTGRFCSLCGAPADMGVCRSCGAALSPGARFCHHCGKPVAAVAGTGGRERIAWLVAGLVVVALSILFILKGGALRPVPAPEMANPGNQGAAPGLAGRAPDISNMSPEERFERLFDRVMRAAESGDTGTVAQFSPMTLAAYSMLPGANADLRFHAALVRLTTADYDGARALADTILTESPGHLFGYLIRGEVADRQNSMDELTRSYRDFLQHYQAELRSGRPEYADHKPVLDSFLSRAEASTGRKP